MLSVRRRRARREKFSGWLLGTDLESVDLNAIDGDGGGGGEQRSGCWRKPEDEGVSTVLHVQYGTIHTRSTGNCVLLSIMGFRHGIA